MPYQTNGVRNYKKENDLYNSKPNERKKRSLRTMARRKANESGLTSKGDGKDLDHKKALSQGGSNKVSNLRVVSSSSNRSFARNADSSIKSQTSKRERRR